MTTFRALPALLLFATSVAAADYRAYVGEGNGDFALLDITTGARVPIASRGVGYAGLAFGPDGTLFGTTFEPGGSVLARIDARTGAQSPIGGTGYGLTTFVGLADGRFFGVDTADRLIAVDPTSGASVVVGPTGLPSLSWFDDSLATDGTRLYYTLGTDGGDDLLYRLDPTSGAATLIGDTHETDIVGSVFASTTGADGRLFGFGASGAIYAIDPTTGATAFYGSSGIGDFYGGVGFVASAASVPEPSTVALLASGLAALARRRQIARRGPSRATTA